MELDIKKPSGKQIQDAQRIYSAEWMKAAFTKGQELVLRAALDDKVKNLNVWDDSKETQRKDLATKIQKNRLKIKKGGLTFTEGKKLALDTLKEIRKLNELTAPRNEMEQNTAESSCGKMFA